MGVEKGKGGTEGVQNRRGGICLKATLPVIALKIWAASTGSNSSQNIENSEWSLRVICVTWFQ